MNRSGQQCVSRLRRRVAAQVRFVVFVPVTIAGVTRYGGPNFLLRPERRAQERDDEGALRPANPAAIGVPVEG
jgi:hypothetical protein